MREPVLVFSSELEFCCVPNCRLTIPQIIFPRWPPPYILTAYTPLPSSEKVAESQKAAYGVIYCEELGFDLVSCAAVCRGKA